MRQSIAKMRYKLRLQAFCAAISVLVGTVSGSAVANSADLIEPIKGNIVPLALVRPSVEGSLIEHRRVAILLADWMICDKSIGSLYIVPKGYMTDFASIPEGMPFFEPFGLHSEAAIAHDWFYAVGEPGKREWADKFFLAKMKALNVPLLKREAMYQAVRLGGEAAYGRIGEWEKRFGDPETGSRITPRFKKRDSARVAEGVDCSDLTDSAKAALLRQEYGSHTWK